ncbi:MAG TPA: hypothetical protein VEZ72_14945, partial [Paenibacillus sp.]|nr:hypothetical protein [Paenibacillus sp.]
MIPDRWKKKLTFLIIPEANRQVRRLRIPVFWLYFAPSAVLAMAAAVAVLASTQSAALEARGSIQAEWT